MKILAFSDLHHSKHHAAALVEASAEADLVIGAGDFCNMRQGLQDAVQLLEGIKAPMVVVPGNAESADELRAVLPTGWTCLHGSGTDIDGLRLFGLGYGVPPTPFGEWSCDLRESDAARLLDQCAATDILISHSPPMGLADVTSGGLSIGSIAVREAIERLQPRLMVCGHVHESWGVTGQIGVTEVINLGPDPNWFNVKLP